MQVLKAAGAALEKNFMERIDSATSLVLNSISESSSDSESSEMMRNRKISSTDIEGSYSAAEFEELTNRNVELETLVNSLKQMLETSRHRERKLLLALDATGIPAKIDFDRDVLVDEGHNKRVPFYQNMIDRAIWLIGLLIFQSGSSFILEYNERLLQTHPTIIYFLTMLVGAGGNAGNQATVRVIREIALGRLADGSKFVFVLREVAMALALCIVVGLFGFVRVYFLNSAVSQDEATTITIALMMIVFISIVVGALLPLSFQAIGIDPANSSTSIQVIMDISGVLITCFVASFLLNTEEPVI